MATKKLYRSKNGKIFGVCEGFAQWKDLPVSWVRFGVVIVSLCTAIVPCAALYVLAAFLLPENPYEEGNGESSYHQYRYTPDAEDLKSDQKPNDKEAEWDNRFYSGMNKENK